MGLAGKYGPVTEGVARVGEANQNRFALGVAFAHADQPTFNAVNPLAFIPFVKNKIARGIFPANLGFIQAGTLTLAENAPLGMAALLAKKTV
jgi:hypothetical protein